MRNITTMVDIFTLAQTYIELAKTEAEPHKAEDFHWTGIGIIDAYTDPESFYFFESRFPLCVDCAERHSLRVTCEDVMRAHYADTQF